MSEWETYELGSLVTFANGGSFPNKYQGSKNKSYDFYKVNDMNNPLNKIFMNEAENTVSNETVNKLKSKLHPKDTIIFPKVGAALLTNKRRILTKESTFDNNIMGVIPNEKIDNKYLFYYLQTIDFTKYAQIGAVPSINKSIVSSLAVEAPMKVIEQQKIASIFSSVDEAIEKTEQIIEQTEQVKKGMMQQLLTKGIGHTEFKDTSIGKVPKSWHVVEFKQLMILQRGYDLPTKKRIPGEVPLLSANGITSYIDKYKVDGPGVITGRSGTIGKVHYIDKNFWPLNTSLYVKEMYNNSPKFLYYFLANYKLERFATGTGVPTLNRNIVHEQNVAVPPFNEQKKIVSILDSFAEKITFELDKLSTLTNLKQGLMQQLLTGKVRVPIDDDEEVTT